MEKAQAGRTPSPRHRPEEGWGEEEERGGSSLLSSLRTQGHPQIGGQGASQTLTLSDAGTATTVSLPHLLGCLQWWGAPYLTDHVSAFLYKKAQSSEAQKEGPGTQHTYTEFCLCTYSSVTLIQFSSPGSPDPSFEREGDTVCPPHSPLWSLTSTKPQVEVSDGRRCRQPGEEHHDPRPSLMAAL